MLSCLADAYSRDAEQSSDAWMNTWPVSIFPSQGAAMWWRSPTPDENLTFDAQDWFERNSPGRQRTAWNAPNQGMWTPPNGLTSTATRFEDVTEQSDIEVQVENTPSMRRSAKRPGSRRDRSFPTGSRNQSRSRSRSPHSEKTRKTSGGITGTLSGLFTSA